MSATLRSPSNGIDAGSVPLQFGNRYRWGANVQDHNFIAVHQNGGHVPQILLVPGQSKQRGIGLGALVDDCGVLLVPQIENSDRPICRNRSKNPRFTPGNVVDLLVVRDELRLDDPLLDIPDGASGVDAGGPNPPGFDVVPVEGGQGGTELAGLAVVEDRNGFDGGVPDFPETEVVAGGGEDVEGLVEGGRVEHELGGRVRVVEGEGRLGIQGKGFRVEGQHVHAIGELFDEASHGDAVVAGARRWRGREGHGVQRIRRLIRHRIVGSEMRLLR